MGCTDISSLDYIYRRHGPIPIEIVGKVAEAVLRGLIYLYDVHRIIHRGECELLVPHPLFGLPHRTGVLGAAPDLTPSMPLLYSCRLCPPPRFFDLCSTDSFQHIRVSTQGTTDPRHQAFQHPREHRGRNQDLRLWCVGRTDQLDRKHLCRYQHLYECELNSLPDLNSLRPGRRRAFPFHAQFALAFTASCPLLTPARTHQRCPLYHQIRRMVPRRFPHRACPRSFPIL